MCVRTQVLTASTIAGNILVGVLEVLISDHARSTYLIAYLHNSTTIAFMLLILRPRGCRSIATRKSTELGSARDDPLRCISCRSRSLLHVIFNLFDFLPIGPDLPGSLRNMRR